MGVESVTTDSHFVNGGAGGIALLGGSPAAEGFPCCSPCALVAPGWQELLRASVAWRRQSVCQRQLCIVSCARGCGGTRGLGGVPELLGGCPKRGGAGGALRVCNSCCLGPWSCAASASLPMPGQFPSVVLWVWNKLALMAPALI